MPFNDDLRLSTFRYCQSNLQNVKQIVFKPIKLVRRIKAIFLCQRYNHKTVSQLFSRANTNNFDNQMQSRRNTSPYDIANTVSLCRAGKQCSESTCMIYSTHLTGAVKAFFFTIESIAMSDYTSKQLRFHPDYFSSLNK